jgi:GntP family gluconate:H+ symporter
VSPAAITPHDEYLYHASLAAVMLWGLVAGIPAAMIAGPLLQRFLVRFGAWRKPRVPANGSYQGTIPFVSAKEGNTSPASALRRAQGHSVFPAPAGPLRALVAILLPVVLILVGGWADDLAARGSVPNQVLHLAGYPDVAMVIAVLVALAILGTRIQEEAYRVRGGLRRLTADSLVPIAGPLVILAAAGGLSGILRASGAAQAAVAVATRAHLPALVLAWALAAAVRVSMGSATVAMAVASGILAPMAGTMGVRPEMLVLATGSGSLILSHVNDSGFWLVESLFKIDVKTTLSTWSVVETVISISGLALTLLLAALLR